MSIKPGKWGKLSCFMIAIVVLYACNTVAPSITNTPDSQPTRETPQVSPTLQPTATTHPKLRPTKTPTIRPTLTETFVFPSDTESVVGDVLNACTLTRIEEVAVLFPNPPQPTNDLKKERGYTVSNCMFLNEAMSLSISIASSPDYIDSLAEHMRSLEKFPSFEQFSASGAEIYQVGAGKEDTGQWDLFAAIIIKDNTAVEIVGSGKSYKYYAERESFFIQRLANRLPPETAIFNACNLITIDEVAALFPNPPAPVNELSKEDGYLTSTCTFRDDNMNLTLAVGSDPDSNRGLNEHMQNVMKEAPWIIEFYASGAEVYQWGGPNDDTKVGEVFMAIVVKGDTAMEVVGNGVFYQYDESRESQLLKAIVSRLP